MTRSLWKRLISLIYLSLWKKNSCLCSGDSQIIYCWITVVVFLPTTNIYVMDLLGFLDIWKYFCLILMYMLALITTFWPFNCQYIVILADVPAFHLVCPYDVLQNGWWGLGISCGNLWWHYDMETFSALLAHLWENPQVIGDWCFLSQRLVMWSTDVSLLSIWTSYWANTLIASDLKCQSSHGILL